jgi:hypothetical protein
MSQKEMPEISINFWLVKISAKGKDGIRLVRWPVAMLSTTAAICFVAATLSVSLGSPLATHWGALKAPLLTILKLVRQWAG